MAHTNSLRRVDLRGQNHTLRCRNSRSIWKNRSEWSPKNKGTFFWLFQFFYVFWPSTLRFLMLRSSYFACKDLLMSSIDFWYRILQAQSFLYVFGYVFSIVLFCLCFSSIVFFKANLKCSIYPFEPINAK